MATLPLIAALGIAVLSTSFLSGLFGMAGGMILMGLLLIALPVPAAMVLHAVTQATSNGWRALLWHRYIDPRIALAYAGGGLAALALYTLVQLVPDRAVVLVALGLTPFLNRLLPTALTPSVSRPGGALACGFICTALQLIAGVAGPLLDMFFVNAPLDRRTVVATKAVTQCFGHLLKLVYFGGLVASGADLPLIVYAVAVGSAMAGTTLARRLLVSMSDAQFRLWSGRVIMAVGVLYLGQGVWAMVGS